MEGINASEVPKSHPPLWCTETPAPGSSSEGEDVVQCVFSISKAAF